MPIFRVGKKALSRLRRKKAEERLASAGAAQQAALPPEENPMENPNQPTLPLRGNAFQANLPPPANEPLEWSASLLALKYTPSENLSKHQQLCSALCSQMQ